VNALTLAPEKLLSAKDVAELKGIARTTIYKWAELGQLTCYRIGASVKFKLSDVDAFIESHRHEGQNR